MEAKKHIKIVILEDDYYCDEILRRYVLSICNEKFFPKTTFQVTHFKSIINGLEHIEPDTTIIIFDYFISNLLGSEIITGQDFMEKARQIAPKCTIVMVSTKRKAPIQIELLKRGINWIIEKNSETNLELIKIFKKIINSK